MRFKMSESPYGAPKGRYVARFDGVSPMAKREQPLLNKKGEPLPPGLEWKFTITQDPQHQGEYVGREVSRITAQIPTAQNSCGRLLAGVLGRDPALGEEVDVSGCVGRLYEVWIDPSTMSPDRTQVVRVEAVGGGSNGPGKAPRPPQAVAVAVAPPSQPIPPSQALPVATGRRWWVAVDPQAEAKEMDDPSLRHWLQEHRRDPATLYIAPLGTSAWQPASAYGFESPLPF